ncbi:MAG: glycosyltransferase [Verrucomicrobia bacterium]|nr:glycosyltransferase [Verrucomicrobiota bacterium]
MKKPTICLNMIVKNERNVIKRSLGSIKKIIDYWVIVDTGSTDETQQIIREFLKDIPGELHERPWVNFEHNRNEALQLARGKADYIYFLDADNEVTVPKNFDKSLLTQDIYGIMIHDPGVDFIRVSLVKSDIDCWWEGVLHEQLEYGKDYEGLILDGFSSNGQWRDGNRAQDPKVYEKDALILEEALKRDPRNTRYLFYLAQSYAIAGNHWASLKNYTKRAEIGGGNPNDVFWSLFCVGCLKEQLGYGLEEVADSFSRAFEFDQSRAEPLACLADHYQRKGKNTLAYITAKQAIEIPLPNIATYILRDIYKYQALVVFSRAAHTLGRLDEARLGYERLLANSELPPKIRTEIEQDYQMLWT